MSAPEKPMTDAITLDALIQAIADRFPDATEDDCRAAAEFVGVNGPFNSLRAATCAIFLLGRRSQRAEWAGKWLVPKPEWDESLDMLIGEAVIGWVKDCTDGWFASTEIGEGSEGLSGVFATEAEARAQVDVWAMEALGAAEVKP